MIFPLRHLRAIRDGEITTAYRRWDRPRVKVGGTQRTSVGVVAFDAVTEVPLDQITDADARAAGHESVDEMLELFGRRSPDWPIWRVDLHYAGEDPRVALRNSARLSKNDVAELTAKLDRLDAASTHGPWTRATLALIAGNEEVRAPDLAASQGRETKPFKLDVRKLKELGLTESLRIGYRISPRGKALMKKLSISAAPVRRQDEGGEERRRDARRQA
jgi:hypothetical protein